MTIITDPIAAVVRFLKTDADTTGMVLDRVFGGELPITENVNMPRCCVVVRNAGGGLHPISSSYIRLNDIRLDTYCYGTTPNQAYRVYRCVAGAMKQMRRTQQGRTVLYWARTAAGPSNVVEGPTEWCVTYSSWQVLYAESEPGA